MNDERILRTLFVYAKGVKVRCLSVNEALNEDPSKDGWDHKATIDPARWIECLVNGDRGIPEMLEELI